MAKSGLDVYAHNVRNLRLFLHMFICMYICTVAHLILAYFKQTISNTLIYVYMYGEQIETVSRLQRRVRDYRANYSQSLGVLVQAKK